MNMDSKELPSKYSQLRVLIVEDNAVDRELLKSHLENFGFENIQEAKNGREGILKIDNSLSFRKPFHLLITDWKMPEKDGLSMIKHVRLDKALDQMRVIMLTSVSEKKEVKAALHEGIDDFILKPIDPQLLLKKIENLAGKLAA